MVKKQIFRSDYMARRCVKCGTRITRPLIDNEVYTCEWCGQMHYVDIYYKTIALTVTERPDIRRRHKEREVTPEQIGNRKELINRARKRKKTYDAWFKEVSEMPEEQRRQETALMGELLRSEYEEFECPYDDGDGVCHADKETECTQGAYCNAEYNIHGCLLNGTGGF